MPFQLELTRPFFLIAMLSLPVVVYFFYRTLVDLPRRQMIVSTVIRSIVILLLVLAMAGLTLLNPTQELFVIFALDESLSVDDESSKSASEFINRAVEKAGNNGYMILPFAAAPKESTKELAEQDDENNAASLGNGDSLNGETDSLIAASGTSAADNARKGTNIQAALEVAAAGIPPHYVPRVVLLTDGNETDGDSRRAALNAGVRIDTVPLKTRDDPEIQVSAVNVPAQVAQGEPFHVEVVIDTNHDDEVLVEIYKGEHKIISAKKELKKGENRFKFQEQVDRPTEFAVRVARTGTGDGKFQDTLLDNNMASGLVFASGKPRVLLIESVPELAKPLEWALEQEGIIVDTRPPQGMPDSLADLQNYEVLMLSNVPATDLSARKMEVIRTYVSDLGGGVIMLGGDQSFGLGGYYKTVIEEILPVRSDFEKEKEKPSLGMVLVIDKSGSMGGQKIELAKDAAKAAVELLGGRDQVGVIAFDGQPYWVSEVRPVSQKTLIEDRISTIQAGGGTTMYPAMDEAYQALQSTTAKLKHVIILTDGHSSPGDFEGLTQQMASSRITVSTVGVGEPDRNLLERIAEIGHGRYYYTNDPLSIPQIFAKETMTASKSAINEEPFIPQVIRSSPVLSEINFEEAPFLLGYVVTRPKPTSEVILVAESGDPLLAWWRYGLGMSVAFTSDAKSRWAAEWLSWPGYNKFWAQVIRNCMRKSEAKGFMVKVERKGSKANVRLDSIDPSGGFLNNAETELTLIDPALRDKKIVMSQIAPGRYEAEISVPDSGAWHMQVSQKYKGQPLYQQSRGLVVGYPDELRLRPTNEELLKSISRATDGVYDQQAEDVFVITDEKAARATPLWPWLLMAALILFLADVALRRIDFSLIFGPLFRRSRLQRRAKTGKL